MNPNNPFYRAALPGAREGSRLMGTLDGGTSPQGVNVPPTGNFTMAGVIDRNTGQPKTFRGVFTAIDDATRMLVAGTHEDYSLTCATLIEQFTAQPAKQTDITYMGQVFRIRDTASDGLFYVFKLFGPT
jgi:hypothetical protein